MDWLFWLLLWTPHYLFSVPLGPNGPFGALRVPAAAWTALDGIVDDLRWGLGTVLGADGFVHFQTAASLVLTVVAVVLPFVAAVQAIQRFRGKEATPKFDSLNR